MTRRNPPPPPSPPCPRAQQDEGDQLEDDPIDEELANLDSDALRVYTLQQRKKHRQGFMAQAAAISNRSQRTRAPRKQDEESYLIEWKKISRTPKNQGPHLRAVCRLGWIPEWTEVCGHLRERDAVSCILIKILCAKTKVVGEICKDEKVHYEIANNFF